MFTDVSGQAIGAIFRGQEIPKKLYGFPYFLRWDR